VAFRHWLTTKLDVECVRARKTWSVQDADSSVTIVNDVDVNITSACTANVTRHVTVASVGCVYVDNALLANRYCCPYSIYREQVTVTISIYNKVSSGDAAVMSSDK